MASRTARYWIGTIRELSWDGKSIPEWVRYVKGQLEEGEGGFRHWQIYAVCSAPMRLSKLRSWIGDAHWERTRSKAAENYVWKEQTRVGEPFEIGQKPMHRNSKVDWEFVKCAAKDGRLDEIPADVYVRCYNQLTRIHTTHLQPIAVERECFVFWGETGTGKTRRAWQEGGILSYPKDPNSKWWDGYTNQESVIIDEFRGKIDIAHLLRWLDRYPVLVEIKGGSRVFFASRIYITSNIPPEEWYPDLDGGTKEALRRRFTAVVHFNKM